MKDMLRELSSLTTFQKLTPSTVVVLKAMKTAGGGK
jgi:hypothetical protein